MKPRTPARSILRRGGRPSQEDAALIREKILDSAARLFLNDGYGATSIEAIAKSVGISKRTFYHRFEDKADLFRAMVTRLVSKVRPENMASLFEGASLEEILTRIARMAGLASLQPETLALHRLITSESGRFPEIADLVENEGSKKEAIALLAKVLEAKSKAKHPVFAAEQFLQMAISVPQARAVGLGTAMTPSEFDAWIENTVQLFLHGCQS